MPEVVRCRFDHAAAGSSGAVKLSGLKGQLEAWSPSDISVLLSEVEAAARRGWYAAGFVAYEAAPAFDTALTVRSGDPMSTEAPHLPLAWFGLFAESHATPTLPRIDRGAVHRRTESGGQEDSSTWSCETDAPTHEADVDTIRGAIANGDAYLVNYTTRLRSPWLMTQDPFSLYQRLVAGHSTGYHAYLETTDWAVACGSPELFFELESGYLTTRPMKGTAPRGRWPEEDHRQAEALRLSSKERAENVMVVDLLRNDLGRIAVPGSVAVPELWQVERHPTLWQLTSTVTARARVDVSLGDVFAALFPCGSVTGAPKVSAMSIISDLERSPRGVYCGAVGLVQAGSTFDSQTEGVSARFAVAIRTAVVDKARQVVEYGSGGGITWDSAAAAEWSEVLVKTKALTDTTLFARAGDGLLETMGFDPASADDADGGVHNLRRHLARLRSSAAYFGMPPPIDAEIDIAKAVSGLSIPARVRLIFHLDGTIQVETSTLEKEELQPDPLKLCVDHKPVISSDVGLFHKTTDRRRYEDRAGRHRQADDVVLVNERGEVTETTRANLAVRVDGRWWTPPLDCGLLPGVERAELLASGRLTERTVTVDQLHRADEVATFSSLRGWRSAHVYLVCTC